MVATAAAEAVETFRVEEAEASRVAVLVDFPVAAVRGGFLEAVASISLGLAVAPADFPEAGIFQEVADVDPPRARISQTAEAFRGETADSQVDNVSPVAGVALTAAIAEATIAAADFTAGDIEVTTAATIPVIATDTAITEATAIPTATMTSGAVGIPTRIAASIPTTTATRLA